MRCEYRNIEPLEPEKELFSKSFRSKWLKLALVVALSVLWISPESLLSFSFPQATVSSQSSFFHHSVVWAKGKRRRSLRRTKKQRCHRVCLRKCWRKRRCKGKRRCLKRRRLACRRACQRKCQPKPKSKPKRRAKKMGRQTPPQNNPYRRYYKFHRGDSLVRILNDRLMIKPLALRKALVKKLKGRFHPKSYRQGHRIWVYFHHKTNKPKTITYQKNVDNEWMLHICWKGQSCFKKKKGAFHVSVWKVPKGKRSLSARKRFLKLKAVRVSISKTRRTFASALRRSGEHPALVGMLERAYRGRVSLGRVFGGEKIDTVVEKIQQNPYLYKYGNVLFTRFQPKGSKAKMVIFHKTVHRGVHFGGYFLPNGEYPIKMRRFASPVQPFIISSYFGYRFHPIHKIRRLHRGIDFDGPCAQRIYAAASGVVESSRYSGGAGNMVVIRHANGWKTRYMHLSRFKTKKGSRVRQGQLIGLTGKTGSSTACHLHFEVIRNGRHLDPMSVVSRNPGVDRLPCGDMVRFWKNQVKYCRMTRMSLKQCRLSLPSYCYRGYRKTFWKIVKSYCAATSGGQCKHKAPKRAGFWPS